jgi:hypothetical protein
MQKVSDDEKEKVALIFDALGDNVELKDIEKLTPTKIEQILN